jgi:hypothetical protein
VGTVTAPRRLSPAQAAALALLGPLDGARIPGGCDSCNAFQVVRPGVVPGAWNVTVHHDDWCPFLAAREGRR